ncbi:hypothetical protein PENTCL1PPCAC_22487, partial [Pristionchus entomophagus]
IKIVVGREADQLQSSGQITDHRLVAMDSLGLNDDQYLASTYEADIELIDKRLKRLYPYVDFETTQVPTQWNRDDKCVFMRVSHLNLRFTYPDRPGVSVADRKNKMEPGAVRANHPCPLFAGVYYFEVHIKESDGYMGVGLCQKSVKMNRLPGWDSLSYGYHGDDGNFFSASGTGVSYGPTFGKGDVIGCGLNLVRRTVFFTKNGEDLGPAMEIMDSVDELYPTVGLQTPNAMVDVNFGQMPFQYDIYKDIQSVRNTVKMQVNEMKLPPMKKKIWLNGYIASWLATEGHSVSLKIFCEESNTQYDEIGDENVQERKELAKLVYGKRVGDLCDELESKFKNFNVDVRPLAIDLRTQRFAEKVLERISMPPPMAPTKNGISKEGNGCAAHHAGDDLSASSSSISSSMNGSGAQGSGNGVAANSLAAGGRALTATEMMEQGPSCSSSSSTTSLRGGEGMEMSAMSPSRPHKRRSSGAKVVDGEHRNSSVSRPPSDMGPPPRRRSARGREERRREGDEEMEIDAPVDLIRRAVTSKGSMEMSKEFHSKNGGPSSSKLKLTEEELALLLTNTPLKLKGRASRSKSRSGKKKKGWKGIEIVDEGRGMAPSLKEHEEDIKLRCGYTKAEEDEANRQYEEMLKEGQEINMNAKAIMKKHPKVYKYATDALYSVMCNSREEIEQQEIFGESRARCLVHSMNKGLIKLEYANPTLCESKLARLEKSVRKEKVHLMKIGCAIAPFIDIEGLMGRAQDEFLRTKKGTATFYDPNDMRMLERRKVQAEIDERMRVARGAQDIAAKAHRKKKRKQRRKKEREAMDAIMERMEGGGEAGEKKETKKRRKRRDGDEKPPLLTEEMPMEIEDGPSSSRPIRRSRNSHPPGAEDGAGF